MGVEGVRVEGQQGSKANLLTPASKYGFLSENKSLFREPNSMMTL